MAKPKAPYWLTQAFADGVDEQLQLRPDGSNITGRHPRPTYRLASPYCFLAQHDERRRPCSGRLERAHLIPRQRVEAVVWEQLRGAEVNEPCPYCGGSAFVDDVEPECCGNTTTSGECRGDCAVPRQVEVPCASCDGGFVRAPLVKAEVDDLILLAAWDPRNAVIGCEGHHRRFDNHATPVLVIPAPELPDHMLDFIFDWGLETQAEARFPNFIRY